MTEHHASSAGARSNGGPSPRPLADKLGIRHGATVAILGVPDLELRDMLAERAAALTDAEPGAAADLIFLAAESTGDLGQLSELRRCLKAEGAIWVVSRKGRDATLRDVDVIEAAIASGLVDNKVVSFSPTHTALRLVIPRRLRPDHAHG
jgi:Protein of unknown function (DUF3052)